MTFYLTRFFVANSIAKTRRIMIIENNAINETRNRNIQVKTTGYTCTTKPSTKAVGHPRQIPEHEIVESQQFEE